MKTIEQLLTWGSAELSLLFAPLWEAQLILGYVLHCPRSQLIAFPERNVVEDDIHQFKEFIQKRKKGVPFAYITGHKDFYDITLKVTRDTLIPRPDTETLIDLAFNKIDQKAVPSVIDLGTGSGAIALVIKKHRPNTIVTATDQSAQALVIAKENAQALQLDIRFIQSNWFSNLKHETFDFILSNPPYIDEADPHLVGDGVAFEPISALVAKDSGYADLYTLIDESRAHLNDNGWLMMEHGASQGAHLRAQLIDYGYKNISTHKDIGGNPRITEGQWSKS